MVSIPLVLELGVAGHTAAQVTGLAVAETGFHGAFWILGGVLVLIIAVIIWRR